MAGSAENTAMTAGRDIAAGPRVSLLYRAGGEDTLLLDQHGTREIASLIIGPDPRRDVVDRVYDILWPVIANQTLWPLCGVPADRHCRVDEQIEPVDRFLDARASLS